MVRRRQGEQRFSGIQDSGPDAGKGDAAGVMKIAGSQVGFLGGSGLALFCEALVGGPGQGVQLSFELLAQLAQLFGAAGDIGALFGGFIAQGGHHRPHGGDAAGKRERRLVFPDGLEFGFVGDIESGNEAGDLIGDGVFHGFDGACGRLGLKVKRRSDFPAKRRRLPVGE